ncbi:hypothetical protein WR25_08516 [Diploscapter pachys]|uniref:Uncharacterized protein n=1 Tax=Diploscapter pachys TaxID=2018661 RepID=A0A2A2LFP8_9BILA|nr:hypothetical protein WR25_08516 [Diploscapter pachys]
MNYTSDVTGSSDGSTKISTCGTLLPQNKALVHTWVCHPEGAQVVLYLPNHQASRFASSILPQHHPKQLIVLLNAVKASHSAARAQFFEGSSSISAPSPVASLVNSSNVNWMGLMKCS